MKNLYEFEIVRRRLQVSESKVNLGSPVMVVDVMKKEGYHNKEREHLLVFHLDTKNNIRGYDTVAVGSNNCASLDNIGNLFRGAIINGAVSVILAHNHPSGDSSPSTDDVKMTKAVFEGGKLLGINVIDHIIIGDGENFFSFREQNMMYF